MITYQPKGGSSYFRYVKISELCEEKDDVGGNICIIPEKRYLSDKIKIKKSRKVKQDDHNSILEHL